MMDGLLWRAEDRLKSVSICCRLLDLGRHVHLRRYDCVVPAIVSLLFAGQELELLQDDLRTRLRRVIPVEPRVEREPPLHVEPVPFPHIAGDRLRLFAERGDPKPIGLLDPSIRCVPESVRGDREVRDERAVVRDLGLRFLAEVADKRNMS